MQLSSIRYPGDAPAHASPVASLARQTENRESWSGQFEQDADRQGQHWKVSGENFKYSEEE